MKFGGAGRIRTCDSFWEPDLQSGALNHSSHVPTRMFGAGCQPRTDDLLLTRQVLLPPELNRQITVQAISASRESKSTWITCRQGRLPEGPPGTPHLFLHFSFGVWLCLNCRDCSRQNLVFKKSIQDSLRTRQIGIGTVVLHRMHGPFVECEGLPFAAHLTHTFSPRFHTGTPPIRRFSFLIHVPAAVSFRVTRFVWRPKKNPRLLAHSGGSLNLSGWGLSLVIPSLRNAPALD